MKVGERVDCPQNERPVIGINDVYDMTMQTDSIPVKLLWKL